MEVLLFRTNVLYRETAEVLISALVCIFPGAHVSFDLDDCDKILRLKGGNVAESAVQSHLQRQGFTCEPL